MQRKAYVSSAVALLATVLLGGCTSDSGAGASAEDAKPGVPGAPTASAEPGKYRTLPEACGQVDHGTLDKLLPGIKDIQDDRQRERAYDGTAAVTYDTDRRVGCRWKMEGADAADHLMVDFERVVSYDAAVSDDSRAEQVFATKEADAHLADPARPGTPADGSEGGAGGAGSKTEGGDEGGVREQGAAGDGSPAEGDDGSAGSVTGATPDDLRSRLLNGLGDAAFLDDSYAPPSSAGRHRTVTVVFRTSNVIVTIEYDEQPTRADEIPDSKEMQDEAQKLAHKLADQLSG